MQALPRLFARLAPLAALSALLATSCAHSYHVEDRDTPVHVWLTAPDLAGQGGTLDARITVGGHTVVEGPVTFEAGRASVALPTLRLRTGSVPVTAVLEGGRIRASQQAGISRESWIQVVVRQGGATIRVTQAEPPAQLR